MPVLEACLEVRGESSEIPKLDSLSNFAHDVKVKWILWWEFKIDASISLAR